MKVVPKYRIGTKVVLIHDQYTLFSVVAVKENQYGYPLYNLSGDEYSLKDVPESDIEEEITNP